MADAELTVELSYTDGRLTLTRISKLPPGDPCAGDLELRVCAEAYGFEGEARVWVAVGAWARFVDALRELEARRQGEAHVASMSPQGFDLTIRAIDLAGHIGVFGHLARYTSALGGYVNGVRFAFEICPTLLPAFVRDCADLACD